MYIEKPRRKSSAFPTSAWKIKFAQLGFLAILALLAPLLNAANNPEAETYLKIESIEPSAESHDTVNVTLRNVSDQTVTAWCLDISGGASDGTSPFHETRTEDLYEQEDTASSNKPLKPGQATVRQLSYPNLDFSRERFENGDYSVLSVRIGCLFLNDGTSYGQNTSAMESIQLRRLAELQAALRFQRDVEGRAKNPVSTLAWFQELRADRYNESTRPFVLHHPTRAEMLEATEQRSYERIAYFTAATALRLYELRGLTPAEVLKWVESDLAKTISNGFRNLPESLHGEAQ